MNELSRLLRHLASPDAAGSVLATLVSVAGSSYRRPGARMVVTASGQRIGSISGGCLEEDVIARSHAVAAAQRPEVVTYDTTTENDLVWGVGLGCHGVVEVLLEPIAAPPAWAASLAANREARQPTDIAVAWRNTGLVPPGTCLARDLPTALPVDAAVFRQRIEPPLAITVFGAGDDVQPLVRQAKELGWHVTIADARPDYATAERFPLADRLVVAPADKLVSQAGIARGAVAVVMTHRYVHDVPILRTLLQGDPLYVGLLGPKQRANRILADLLRESAAPAREGLDRLHAPVGLDLGAETPEEVALSILAEIRATLAGRDGRPLRERTRPIHG